MITRADYIEGRASHDEYYLEIAKELGIKPDDEMIQRAKKALEAGDEHLNTIPLREWDVWAMSLLAFRSPEINRAFCKRGTVPAMADLVCMLKAVTRYYARQ